MQGMALVSARNYPAAEESDTYRNEVAGEEQEGQSLFNMPILNVQKSPFKRTREQKEYQKRRKLF